MGNEFYVWRGPNGLVFVPMVNGKHEKHTFYMVDNPCNNFPVWRGDEWHNPETCIVLVRDETNAAWVRKDRHIHFGAVR